MPFLIKAEKSQITTTIKPSLLILKLKPYPNLSRISADNDPLTKISVVP